MSRTYFIRGTITMRVEIGVPLAIARVGVTPCVGFLTPDKEPKAIAFPITETTDGTDHKSTARLIDLNGKSCEFDAELIKDSLPALLSIAGQNKLVEIRLSVEGTNTSAADFKVVGFVYPAP